MCNKCGGTSYNNADAATLIQQVLDNVASGDKIFLRNHEYVLSDFLIPKGYHSKIIGESMYKTILKPADSSISKIFSYEEKKGTSEGQLYCHLENLCIDMAYAANSAVEDSKCIELYNIINSFFRRLWLKNYRFAGIYAEGHGFTVPGYDHGYWNQFHYLHTYSPSAFVPNTTYGKSLFHIKNNFIDSYIHHAHGVVAGGYGFTIHGRGDWRIEDMWLCNCKSLWRLEAKHADIYNVQGYRCIADTFSEDGFLFKLNGYNINRVKLDHPHFLIMTTDDKSFFKFIGQAGKSFTRIRILHPSDSAISNHGYIVSWDGVGTFYRSCKIEMGIHDEGSDPNTVGQGFYEGIPNCCFLTLLNPPRIIPFRTTGTVLTWSDMPEALTEFQGNTCNRAYTNLVDARLARLIANIETAGSTNAKLRVQYSLNGTTWYYLDNTNSKPSVAINTTGVKVSGWCVLDSGARDDVYLRIVGIDGDGVADPAFGHIVLEIK